MEDVGSKILGPEIFPHTSYCKPLPIGPIVCSSFLRFIFRILSVIPKRNYYGAYGYPPAKPHRMVSQLPESLSQTSNLKRLLNPNPKSSFHQKTCLPQPENTSPLPFKGIEKEVTRMSQNTVIEKPQQVPMLFFGFLHIQYAPKPYSSSYGALFPDAKFLDP